MSVGKITIRNYNDATNELCWRNGFEELELNPHSARQMKQLDKNRNRLFYKLQKDLIKLQIFENSKPFSYFYQVLERKSKASKLSEDHPTSLEP
jgi:hypothetical protein